MADDKTTKDPISLYVQCLNIYVYNLSLNVASLNRINALRTLPPVVLTDIYYTMSTVSNLNDILLEEMSNLTLFAKLVRFGAGREKLFKCVTALMSNHKPIVTNVSTKFCQYALYRIENCSWNQQQQQQNDDNNDDNKDILKKNDDDDDEQKKEYLQYIDFGLRLGTFLSEAGWMKECIMVMKHVLLMVKKMGQNKLETMLTELDCLQRLLLAQSRFCYFQDAETTFNLINELVEKIGIDRIPNNLLVNFYKQVSVLHFARSEYDQSYSWSIRALQKIRQNTPDKIAIDVLLQAAKSCVVKRQFKRANMLITQAVKRTINTYGKDHQKYADALLDYGFYLINVDLITCSVTVYNEALEIKRKIFGNLNLHVALAHEDLAYALYVREYSSGQFQNAREHVEKAISIMKNLVPSNHLMLASAKRVKALILEEIALDNMLSPVNTEYKHLLEQSEELHQSALQLSLEAFGEINVQTAKHYGNLGRLYQTMSKFDDAEQMHQRAIKIKTDILGAYDYEVGLSIGHLASLYNYHMKKHREAEELYLRSIGINLALFGDSYSGLEYDYRGLCHVYEALRDTDKYLEYARILDTWRVLRQENDVENKPLYVELKEDTTMEEVTKKFFEMCSESEMLANA